MKYPQALSQAALLAVSLAAAPAIAQESFDREAQFSQGAQKSGRCMACHGPAGEAETTTYPDLAGQNAGYLALQLEKFRSGERFHPLMTPVAKELSDQDIQDLSIYYSQLE